VEFETKFEFELPKGYVDKEGTVHKRGVMRLASAADEILPLRDPRVVSNPGYLTIILLGRVIVSLGTLQSVNNNVIEGLFSADLAFLQALYQTINAPEEITCDCECPSCGHKFRQPVNFTAAQ
jgi:hypothetical protein